MKFPKLRHAGLCNILIFLPALFLFFAIGFNIPLANWGTPKWVLALNFLLGCAVSLGYLILGAFPLLCADQFFFLLREWKRSSLEYRTGRNGRGRSAIQAAILRRCRRWSKPVEGTEDISAFYRNRGCVGTRFYSAVGWRAAVCSVPHLDADTLRRCRAKARLTLARAPEPRPSFLTPRAARREPKMIAPVLIVLADTLDEELKRVPYKQDELRLCLVDCTKGAYYFDCRRDYYDIGAMEKPKNGFQVQAIRRLIFGGRLPKGPAELRTELPPDTDPEQSFWTFYAGLFAAVKSAFRDAHHERRKMLRRLRPGEIRMGEYALYCGLGDRVAVLMYTEKEGKKHLLLEKDLAAYGTSGKSRTRRRRITPEEQKSCRARLESWLVAEGYRFEAETEK